MGDYTKDELVGQAADLGVAEPEKLKKTELEDRIEAFAPPELGPVVPEGEIKPAAPKASGSATKGVQPLEDADIPDAGR